MSIADTQTAATATAPQGVKPHRQIKLGVDVHWRQYVVVRQIDDASPQPPQRFTPEEFLAWAKKQTQLADEVHCCYEAGPFGFVLHKRLVALGVKSLVVRPRNWDEYSKKVKTDRRDALALLSSLDRYLAGNKEALTVIRVPSDDEEKARSDTRQREQLLAERKRFGGARAEHRALLRPRFAGGMVADKKIRGPARGAAGVPAHPAGSLPTAPLGGQRRVRRAQHQNRVRAGRGAAHRLGRAHRTNPRA